MTCTKKDTLTEGPERGGGGEVNVGHSLSPPSHVMLATGLQIAGFDCITNRCGGFTGVWMNFKPMPVGTVIPLTPPPYTLVFWPK